MSGVRSINQLDHKSHAIEELIVSPCGSEQYRGRDNFPFLFTTNTSKYTKGDKFLRIISV